MIIKIRHYLFCLFLFILPWQTRYMYVLGWKNGQPFEYTTLSIYATELLLGVVLLLLIIELLHSEDFRARLKQRTHAGIFLSILIIILPIIFFWRHSIYPQISWQYLNWVLYGVCAGTIIFWQKNKVKDFLLALWWSGVVQGALAIWQFFTQNISAHKWLGLAAHDPSQLGAGVLLQNGERWMRAYGSFPWPNALGIYLAVIMVLGMIIYLQTKKTAWYFWFGQLLIFSGLILSFSRAAYLGAVVGLVILFWKNKNHIKKIVEFLIPQIVLAIIFLILLFPLFTSRVVANNYLEQRAINERITQVGEFKNIFLQNVLFGIGPGAYGVALSQTYPEKQIWQLQLTHNIFLLFLAEWGIVGALLFLLLFFYFVRHSSDLVRRSSERAEVDRSGGGYNFFKSHLFIKFNWAPLAVLIVAGFFDHWSLSAFTGIIFLCIISSLSIIDTP